MAKKPAPRPVKVKPPQRLAAVRKPLANLDPGALKLQGRPAPVAITRAVTNISLEQTKTGASTLALTIRDYTGALVRSQLLKGKVSLTFDGMLWSLVKIERADRAITCSFEEMAVTVLRGYSNPRKARRVVPGQKGGVTRAQFVRALITEPTEYRIQHRIPEVNKRQPIAAASTPGGP